MLSLINAHRAQAGAPPLRGCGALSTAAQAYSVVLMNSGVLSHTCPNGSTPRTRIDAAGYRNWTWIGENIAMGYPTVASVVEAWMASPGHRANILNPSFEHLGIGVTSDPSTGRMWWVQKFGASGTC